MENSSQNEYHSESSESKVSNDVGNVVSSPIQMTPQEVSKVIFGSENIGLR